MGSPIPSMTPTFFSKKLAGISSDTGSTFSIDIEGRSSGLTFLMVAAKLKIARERAGGGERGKEGLDSANRARRYLSGRPSHQQGIMMRDMPFFAASSFLFSSLFFIFCKGSYVYPAVV